MHLGVEKHHERVNCLAQERNVLPQARTAQTGTPVNLSDIDTRFYNVYKLKRAEPCSEAITMRNTGYNTLLFNALNRAVKPRKLFLLEFPRETKHSSSKRGFDLTLNNYVRSKYYTTFQETSL